MLRLLYRCALALHPRGFRDRFADEILSIFDAAPGPRAKCRLLYDGFLSAARQWALRPEFWQGAPIEHTQSVPDGVPAFQSLDSFRPRTAALLHGLVLSTLVFSLTCFAIKYSWIHVLHVRIPEVQFERSEWIPPASGTSASSEESSAQAIAGQPGSETRTAAEPVSSSAAPRERTSDAAAEEVDTNQIAQAPATSDAQVLEPSATPFPPNAQVVAAMRAPIIPKVVLPAATERQFVIAGVIANLKQYYVYPDRAQTMARALQAHQQHGDYDESIDGKSFADLLTSHLRETSRDQHLRVTYTATAMPEGALGSTPEELARYRKEMLATNCTFEKAEMLPHNIGYLKFNSFPDVSLCQPAAAAAMASLNEADAIIFDLRDNGGGDPRMVALMESYLFEHPMHLDDLYNPSENSTLQSWTMSPISGNELANKPAYVLTSHSTFSGAEEFAYDLKMLKRATLIGETTAGAAHMVRRRRIDDHFSIGVPDTRPINAISGTDWEGTGVAPDIKVSTDDALNTAESVAVQSLPKQ